jgi:hypothetical protein
MEVMQSEFARMAFVSRAAISEKAKRKTIIVNSAGKIDTDNPVNRSYLDRHQRLHKEKLITQNAVSRAQPVENYAADAAPDFNDVGVTDTSNSNTSDTSVNGKTSFSLPEEIWGVPERLLNCTISELISQFGAVDNLERYATILLKLTNTHEKEQRLKERRLVYVEKDFVSSRLFSCIDTILNQILDFPESCADQIVSTVLSQGIDSQKKVINDMRDGLTKIISDAKNSVMRELDSLKNKHNDDDTLTEIRDKLEEVSV